MKSQYIEKLLPDVYSSSCICIITTKTMYRHRKREGRKERKKETIKERKKREMLITTTLVSRHVLSPTFEK